MVIRDHSKRVRFSNADYRVRVCGRQRSDGTWTGWIEFQRAGGKSVLRTGQETSQPNFAAIEYWADGLEPIYFEGALARAQGHTTAPATAA